MVVVGAQEGENENVNEELEVRVAEIVGDTDFVPIVVKAEWVAVSVRVVVLDMNSIRLYDELKEGVVKGVTLGVRVKDE